MSPLNSSVPGDAELISSRVLRPPRAGAIAGVISSVLMVVALGIIRVAVPADPASMGEWLIDPIKRRVFSFALNLVPFAGIAFLWFMGVLRSRLGKLEDQFFATVFLGSGLLFVASLFMATAIAGAFLEGVNSSTGHFASFEIFVLVRRVAHALVNVFAIKMAAVFMFSTCSIAHRTAVLPRWIAYSGFVCGLVLVIVITNWEWIALVFPLWILLVSSQVLVADLLQRQDKQPC
jgi:hypothetical protein